MSASLSSDDPAPPVRDQVISAKYAPPDLTLGVPWILPSDEPDTGLAALPSSEQQNAPQAGLRRRKEHPL